MLVKITTDDGIVGWGESALWGGPPSVSQVVIEKEIFPLIEGENPLRPEYLWEKVYQETYYHGRKGILLACLSGVDIAVWDIFGKAAGKPLWQILGGFGRPVESYASSGYYRADRTMDDFANEISGWIARGFKGYKMKIGNTSEVIHAGVTGEIPLRRSFEDDIARIATARAAAGEGRLFVDANTSLDAAQAMRYADRLEALDIGWFEEPVQPENIAGAVKVAQRTRIPIAGFETETNKFTFKHLIDAGAMQIVQPDVVQVGGLTEARKDCGLCADVPSPLHLKELFHRHQPGCGAVVALCDSERALVRTRDRPASVARRDRHATGDHHRRGIRHADARAWSRRRDRRSRACQLDPVVVRPAGRIA